MVRTGQIQATLALAEEHLGLVQLALPDLGRKQRVADVSCVVTGTPEKGVVIESWRQEDGTFRLPEVFSMPRLVVRDIVLVDDKATAFQNLPKNVRGYLYRPTGRPVFDFQEGSVPDSVTTISSLLDILP